MVCMPTPAAVGLNIPPLTPAPLYVPPEGIPPVRANADVFTHTDWLAGQLISGGAFTATTFVHDDVQPFAVVKVTDTV